MSEKFYTPEEVAREVLKKAAEMAKESRLFKANTSHEIEAGSEPKAENADCPDQLEDQGIVTEGEKKHKSKSEGSKPAHEEGMEPEEEMVHDAIENESDEMDDDIIEADEEPESKALDAAIEEEAAEEDDEDEDDLDEVDEIDKDGDGDIDEIDMQDKTDKKKPFGKSEIEKCGDMKKAKVDEGKTKESKQQARKMRNSRVKFAAGSPEGSYKNKKVRPRKEGEGDKVFGEPKYNRLSDKEKMKIDLKKKPLKKFIEARQAKKSCK